MQDYLARIEQRVDKVEDWSRLPSKPLVSVAVITYNHEPFVSQALDSILMQEADFDYEIMIGEDKSTDRTREIVEDYQRRHPDKIRLRLARENLYSQKLKPLFGVFTACRGQYIAMCEGDDYWTDPKKLQKQVDFLEAKPEYVGCSHRVKVELPNRRGFVHYEHEPVLGTDITMSGMVRGRYPHILSLMYRREALSIQRLDFSRFAVGDIPLLLILVQQGKIHFDHEAMGVHRALIGSWSTRDMVEKTQKLKKMILAMDEIFLPANRGHYQNFRRRWVFRAFVDLYRYAVQALNQSRFEEARQAFVYVFVWRPSFLVFFLSSEHAWYDTRQLLFGGLILRVRRYCRVSG